MGKIRGRLKLSCDHMINVEFEVLTQTLYNDIRPVNEL